MAFNEPRVVAAFGFDNGINPPNLEIALMETLPPSLILQHIIDFKSC
ncbi:hypothetical protein Goshw_004304 [Gossypium schwendimanii]|nr:hypothetical protein [Gossypium schwendimanii]